MRVVELRVIQFVGDLLGQLESKKKEAVGEETRTQGPSTTRPRPNHSR